MTTQEAVEYFNPVQLNIFKRKVAHTCSLGYRYLDRMSKKRWNECVKHTNALTIAMNQYLIGLTTPELTDQDTVDVLRVIKDVYQFKAWVVHFADDDEMRHLYNKLMSTIADIEQSLSTDEEARFEMLSIAVTCALQLTGLEWQEAKMRDAD